MSSKAGEFHVGTGDRGGDVNWTQENGWNVYRHQTGCHHTENQKFLLVVFIYRPTIHFREQTWHFHSIDSSSLILMVLKELASDSSSSFPPWHFSLFRGYGRAHPALCALEGFMGIAVIQSGLLLKGVIKQ